MSKILRLLAIETGLGEAAVQRISNTAPERYKTYYIPKRNGDRRKISQPAPELKLVQRALIEILIKHLPVHRCATAYKSKSSIYDNALPHVGRGPIIKMDFKNFFPSIRTVDWIEYCKKTGCLDSIEDINITTQLLFQKQREYKLHRLAIGAPSSPMLSNVLLFEFDSMIENLMQTSHVTYTRYADDLTFSAPRTGYMHNVRKNVLSTIRFLKHPKLRLNNEKTVYITSKYNRTVTGLVLSNDGRVTIGHKKKREIHAAVHQLATKDLYKGDIHQLSGMLAYINAVEPEFIEVLKKKYGVAVIVRIQKSLKPRTGRLGPKLTITPPTE